MNARLFAAVLGLALVIGGLAALSGLDSCRRAGGGLAEHNAAVAQGEANAHQSQAQAHDSEVADLQAQLVAREADLGRLSRERDALRRKLAAVGQSNSHPANTGSVGADDSEPSGNSGELDLLRATVAKDAEVIEAQELLIKNQSESILVVTKARDEWKATAEARERQALAQEAATKAWKDAVTSSRWRGRVEGFAAGVALGYVGGRR